MAADTETSLPEPAGMLGEPTVAGLPRGYKIGVTRYADLILRDALSQRFADLVTVLRRYRIDMAELIEGGGAKASHTARFDSMLEKRGWGKRTIRISKMVDDRLIHATRGHEIDMFGVAGSPSEPYPGVAVEMEWNNKDPFFDRDLLNFQALHREGALAVGVIVTRGPTLQRIIGPTIKTSAASRNVKFGKSSTHWDKLVPRVNLGGGGECPLILIGIEPARIDGFATVRAAFEEGRQIPKPAVKL